MSRHCAHRPAAQSADAGRRCGAIEGRRGHKFLKPWTTAGFCAPNAEVLPIGQVMRTPQRPSPAGRAPRGWGRCTRCRRASLRQAGQRSWPGPRLRLPHSAHSIRARWATASATVCAALSGVACRGQRAFGGTAYSLPEAGAPRCCQWGHTYCAHGTQRKRITAQRRSTSRPQRLWRRLHLLLLGGGRRHRSRDSGERGRA